MTRVATGPERAGRSPGTLTAQHDETPSERFDRQFADGGVESEAPETISPLLPAPG